MPLPPIPLKPKLPRPRGAGGVRYAKHFPDGPGLLERARRVAPRGVPGSKIDGLVRYFLGWLIEI